MQIFDSSDVSAFWFHAYCLLGLGLLVGVLLRLLAQKTRVYTGTLYKLCHRPRSSELVWIAAFNQSTVQLPLTYGIFIFPPHCRFIRSEKPPQAPNSPSHHVTVAAQSATAVTLSNSPSTCPLAPGAPTSPRQKWAASFGATAATPSPCACATRPSLVSLPIVSLGLALCRYLPRRLFLPPALQQQQRRCPLLHYVQLRPPISLLSAQ